MTEIDIYKPRDLTEYRKKTAPINKAVAVQDIIRRRGQTLAQIERGREAAGAKWVLQGYAPGRVSIETVISCTANYYGFTAADLKGQSRKASIVRARHVALYLAKELTGRTLALIAERMGNRDHTISVYAVAKIGAQMETDALLAKEVRDINRAMPVPPPQKIYGQLTLNLESA